MKKSLIIILTIMFMSTVAFAHSGRTNSEDCHKDTKKGTYHCH
ncbi:YHYH domain-containing protein [Cycloclasticus pugetii]|nr:hypothetical protein SAMN05519226_2205 [Cycloclasticus pugetii]